MRHRIFLAVMAGAALVAVAAPSALAQGVVCCRVAAPPVAYAPAVAPYVSAPYYVVNQGPVYSGPGIFTVPTYIPNSATFAPYPYVYTPGFYAPRGYGPPPYVRSSYRPRGAYVRRPPPYSGVIDLRGRYGHFRPPIHRPMRPSHNAVPPSEGYPPLLAPPRMAPPLPPQRPGKPVEEQWTRGLPLR
jgi:hypothetical protein